MAEAKHRGGLLHASLSLLSSPSGRPAGLASITFPTIPPPVTCMATSLIQAAGPLSLSHVPGPLGTPVTLSCVPVPLDTQEEPGKERSQATCCFLAGQQASSPQEQPKC